MSEDLLNELKEDINERQVELHLVQQALEDYAKRNSTMANRLKIAIILLGGIVATREVADKIVPAAGFPNGNKAIIVSYTLVGLLIAVIGGVAAAFRYENKAAELKVLAAESNSYLLDIDCKLPKKGDPEPTEKQINAARDLISLQNSKLSEIQGKAARIGIGINRKVRKIRVSGNVKQ
ncbi:MAG: hypothetical protein ACR2G4_02030 [Pyrinomonadaceae bacterium]